MWIFAVIAMLCWSGSDILNKAGSNPKDKYSHYKVGIAVGLIMGLHAIYMVVFRGVNLNFSHIVLYFPATLMYISSMLVGYLGLRYIELSILSPICNGSGGVAAIMSMVWFGVTFNPNDESGAFFLNAPIITGIVLIVAGIISLGLVDYFEDEEMRLKRQQASNRKYAKSALAILLPVIYCILDSLGTFADMVIADKYVASLEQGGMSAEAAELLAGDVLNTAYEFTWLFVAVVFAIYIFVIKKEKIEIKYDGTKLLGGICETLGQVFYMVVVVSGFTPGLVIVSAYCALSLIWGRIFLKEKLSFKHYLAIAAAIVGIVILGVYDI